MTNAKTHADGLVEHLLGVVRRRVLLRAVLRAGAIGVAAAALLLATLLWLDVALGLPPTLRTVTRWLPLAALLATLIPAARAPLTATRTRLTRLIDERSGLGNLLTTYLAPNAEGPVAEAFRQRAAVALHAVDPGRIVPMEAGRLWGWAAAATLLAVASLVGTSASLGERASTPSSVGGRAAGRAGLDEGEGATLPTLGTLRITLEPPAYAGLSEETVADGAALSALPGTIVRIAGNGTARSEALVARVAGGTLLPTVSDAEGWQLEWRVAPEHRGVSIEAVASGTVVEQRVIAVRLLRDRAPNVSLTAPDADLVLAEPSGTIPIHARALDDYGIAELSLHWVHSRGSGESFDFSEGEWRWDAERPLDGGREATVDVPLDELDLAPGDVIHLRAVARDGNDVTGPGVGVSATRQIRISSEDDLADVTTLIGFPIEREREPLLSQRMIILLTEELRDTARHLTSESLLEQASAIADAQARLRGRIGEQIFSRATGAMQDPEAHLDFEDGESEVFLDELEAAAALGPVIDPETGIATIANVNIPAHDHDSDPIVAINRALLTAYNYMWDAERELRSAMLDPALVPQYLALDLLQEMRDSERVFARGRVATPIIDVDGARGSGEVNDADPAPRSRGTAPAPVAEQVVATLDALLATDPVATGRAAAVTISGLALDLLEALDDPTPGEALAQAAALASADDGVALRERLTHALTLLTGSRLRASSTSLVLPTSLAAARFDQVSAEGTSNPAATGPSTAHPFIFATVRYSSGDWDSAPLVPSNLIHSLAQYTALPVQPEGVIVDLSSEDVFDYPFLYLTGHLPVFFDDAESRNLVAFVERGGFIFIDDHNHDIDGAFHRSVTEELRRLFGHDRLTAIPNDHELYTSFFHFDDGPPITGHELSGWGDGLIHRELFQVEVEGRIGVLYSNKDYSSEWSYHAENKRFLAIDNTRFGVNILVYALTR